MRPFRVFFAQIVGTTLSTGSWMVFAATVGTHPFLCVPFAVFGSLSALIAVITAIIKMDKLMGNHTLTDLDWKRYKEISCNRCFALQTSLNAMTRDRDETRQALISLKID